MTIISHGPSCRYDELCLFEALYPLPLARPFSKGLRAGAISHGLSYRCGELCLFEALYPAPSARPFSKGLLAGGCLTWVFMPLRRIVPLRGTPSCAFGAALLQGPTRGGLSHMGFHSSCRIVSCSVIMLTRSRRYATTVRRVRPWRRARPKAGTDESASFRISS